MSEEHEKKQQLEMEALDEQYQLDCCVKCNKHLWKVRKYPAVCGMCQESTLDNQSEPYFNYSRFADMKMTDDGDMYPRMK